MTLPGSLPTINCYVMLKPTLHTRQEDPVVHFYETFLTAYDPELRELRGVYYTPEPVVSYIVHSVDHLLKARFGCTSGLADTSTVTYQHRNTEGRDEERQAPQVLLLDPATGTATFLYAVINHIREEFKRQNNAGLWSAYVREQLLSRLFGFELLMAPYAVAHLKLGLQLSGLDLPEQTRRDWAYDFDGQERLGVYLTNSLDEAAKTSDLLLGRFISEEANAAAEIKRDLPIMVVLGNPPYRAASANNGEWIRKLVSDYYYVDGRRLRERNPRWLQDDYVKFIRFAQWRIHRTGSGILAYITNHGYLDNATFRGMRQQLMNEFTDIYVLNLHGKPRDKAPDGRDDKNVFDITRGVAIGIFVKEAGKDGPATVHYADLWGGRDGKYAWLTSHSVETTDWISFTPAAPFYDFTPEDKDLRAEYNRGWKVPSIFPKCSVGIVTARDPLTVHETATEVWNTVTDFSSLPVEEARSRYDLGRDTRDWKVSLAQRDVKASGPSRERIVPLLYRPFDARYTYYTGVSRGFLCMPRSDVMHHMLMGKNVGLVSARSNRSQNQNHFFCSRYVTEAKAGESTTQSYLFPLYRYPSSGEAQVSKSAILEQELAALRQAARDGLVPIKELSEHQDALRRRIHTLFPDDQYPRWPNFYSDFIEEATTLLGLSFNPDGCGDLVNTVGPEDLFHYIYAVFHSPAYRRRYAGFLKTDFPRVPLTADLDLFRQLTAKGADLVSLHLLESQAVQNPTVSYPVRGSNRVEAGHPRYVTSDQLGQNGGRPFVAGRVYISSDNARTGTRGQYFEGISQEVWEFEIGGYQVCEKWLKDRRGHILSLDDLMHYERIVTALTETIRLMEEIDDMIPDWPIT